jgi:fatty-acyl-CoA synthase/long-chain acyl-CoA synthetase
MTAGGEMEDFSSWCEVTPIGDLLVRSASLYPTRDAMVFPETRRNYESLLQGAVTVARGLLALGLGRGDHVGFLAINSPELIEGMVGASLLGCVVVPLNARHKSAELAYIVNNAELVALFTTCDGSEYVDYAEVLISAFPELSSSPDPKRLRLTDASRLQCTALLRGPSRPGFLGRAEFDQLALTIDSKRVEAARRCVRVRDIAMVLYTSGTTAKPKGCLLTHEALTRGPLERAAKRLSTGDRNVTWGAGPLFHIGSLGPLIGTIGVGGTYLTDTFFEPGRALQLMVRERVTAAWPWFPAIVLALLDHPSFDAGQLQSLRVMLVICPPALVHRLQSTFPQSEILQACGMTETAGIFAVSDRFESANERATRQGLPEPGIEVRIADVESGDDAGPGVVGELLVRGYCVFDGYFRDPDKTAATLANGWLRTGDLYSRGFDGSLKFNGRLKDMLKVGGENVAAIEVEAFLCEHPAVKLAEVVGIPDPRLDEVPVAFVELRSGSALLAQELIEFCKGRIANYKIPRAVYFVEANEWPMSATKVDKRALRSRLMQSHVK